MYGRGGTGFGNFGCYAAGSGWFSQTSVLWEELCTDSWTAGPIVGKICMDQLAVDVTDIPDVRAGMTATLIGRDGSAEIRAPVVAAQAESISNELLSRMGKRLEIIS